MFENRYSTSQKLLHKLAFSTQRMQLILAEMEEDIYSKQLNAITIEQPVFIAALPRAGTTSLLSLLVDSGSFASHSYRQMPFIHTPILWSKFSHRLAKDETKQERAHGDGIYIDIDSPEALEEMVWKVFWPLQYKNQYIELWSKNQSTKFSHYFKQHIKKIIYLGGEGRRYVSKNNLNISRLPLLRELFPDAHLLIPFREPLQHANSLLKQHRNFLKMHKEDPFSKQYMAGVGHYDFGQNLRPVEFPGDKNTYTNPLELNFWLNYWLRAYQYIYNDKHNNNLQLVGFESFTRNPQEALNIIENTIKLQGRGGLVKQHTAIKAPPTQEISEKLYSTELYQQCKELHEDLLSCKLC